MVEAKYNQLPPRWQRSQAGQGRARASRHYRNSQPVAYAPGSVISLRSWRSLREIPMPLAHASGSVTTKPLCGPCAFASLREMPLLSGAGLGGELEAVVGVDGVVAVVAVHEPAQDHVGQVDVAGRAH